MWDYAMNYDIDQVIQRPSDGMVCLESIQRATAADVGLFLKLDSTIDFVAELAARAGIGVEEIIYRSPTGLWATVELALLFALKINPRFCVDLMNKLYYQVNDVVPVRMPLLSLSSAEGCWSR